MLANSRTVPRQSANLHELLLNGHLSAHDMVMLWSCRQVTVSQRGERLCAHRAGVGGTDADSTNRPSAWALALARQIAALAPAETAQSWDGTADITAWLQANGAGWAAWIVERADARPGRDEFLCDLGSYLVRQLADPFTAATFVRQWARAAQHQTPALAPEALSSTPGGRTAGRAQGTRVAHWSRRPQQQRAGAHHSSDGRRAARVA